MRAAVSDRRADDASPVEVRRAFADRWSAEVAACRYTQSPVLLRQHATDLGLHPVDLCVISVLEDHDWTTNRDGVYPSVATIARHCGCRDWAATQSLHRLEQAGLIEVATRALPSGWRTSNAYTWEGLRQALTLIARNRLQDRDPTEGLRALLDALAENGQRAFTLRNLSPPDRRSESDPETERTLLDESDSLRLRETPLVRGRNPTSPRLRRSA